MNAILEALCNRASFCYMPHSESSFRCFSRCNRAQVITTEVLSHGKVDIGHDLLFLQVGLHENALDMHLLIAFVVLLAEAVVSPDCAQLYRLKVQGKIAVVTRVNLVLLALPGLVIGLIQVVDP